MQPTRLLPVVETLHARHQIDTANLTKVPHTAGERFHRLNNAAITGHDVPRLCSACSKTCRLAAFVAPRLLAHQAGANLSHQPCKIDRLGVKISAADRDAPVSITCERMSMSRLAKLSSTSRILG